MSPTTLAVAIAFAVTVVALVLRIRPGTLVRGRLRAPGFAACIEVRRKRGPRTTTSSRKRDAVEACDGMSDTCPADALVAPGTECQPAAGACEVAASCDGVSTSCPMKTSKPDGALCPGGKCLEGVCMSSSGSMGAGGSGGAGGGSDGGAGGGSDGGAGGERPEDPGDEGGCGCRVAGAESGDDATSRMTLLGLGLSLAMVRLRRRRR